MDNDEWELRLRDETLTDCLLNFVTTQDCCKVLKHYLNLTTVVKFYNFYNRLL
jgi:hypothetical protein